MKHMNTDEVRLNIGENVRVVFSRKAPEINGIWKQYFESKCLRTFPSTSDQLLLLIDVRQPEITGKIWRYSGPEYCFQVPSIARVFLPHTVIFSQLSDQFGRNKLCFRSLKSSIWTFIFYTN
jgi:hypothetical protein